MKNHFFELAQALAGERQTGEILLCSLAAERSDFVRFNRSRVRQAGSVEQRALTLRLVRGRRQASAALSIAGCAQDLDDARRALATLRQALERLPEDPWLLINEAPHSSTSERRGAIACAESVVAQTMAAAQNLDFVGVYAGGTIARGFANSLGQRNWHEVDSFNFDWSLHGAPGEAVKDAYAGFRWDPAILANRLENASRELALLKRNRRELPPGEYRVYFAPRALEELVGLLSWGGFSARARQTRQSPLLRLQEGATLSPLVTLAENTAEGVAAGFQGEGFVKPASVRLIEKGRLAAPLTSPRSAREYGLPTNAANGGESPESLDMAPGSLEQADILAALDRGLYISNLWYLNYSDRPAGRITGMTRFATFWVEGARVLGPVAPMRFDDSILRMLGESLVELTRERELLLDPSTYEARSTSSARLPGALLRALRLTL